MGGLLCKPKQLPTAKVLFLGLKNSGKTTALYNLKLKESVTTVPTNGFNVESFDCQEVKLEVWDVGGAVTKRPQYAPYFKDAQAVVFFIDSSDSKYGLDMAVEKLKTMLLEDTLDSCPIAIVANKQDVSGALCAADLTEKLTQSAVLYNRKWRMFPASAINREGLSLMMTWVERNVKLT